MDITHIETLIAAAATLRGYAPIIASEAGVESKIEVLPTAWIQLPLVLYVEGRDEGLIGHSVTFSLIDDYKGYSPEQQVDRLVQMQDDIIEMMTHISDEDGVVEVSEMTITPRTIPTTRHDNIAQTCKATIVSYF